jgi:hypothetical protein
MRLRHLVCATLLAGPIAFAGTGTAGAAADRNSPGFKACKDSLFTDQQCDCVAAEFATKGKGLDQNALAALATDFTLAGYPEISLDAAKKDLTDLKIPIKDADLKKVVDVVLGAAHCTQ